MPLSTAYTRVRFQSTLSMRRATKSVLGHRFGGVISIHALHEESDYSTNKTTTRRKTFQSTLSMRRATSGSVHTVTPLSFQSTLSMRRATIADGYIWAHYIGISIHALHEESDKAVALKNPTRVRFQSTLSMRRATCLTATVIPSGALFQSTLSMRRATVQLDIFVRFLRRKPAA